MKRPKIEYEWINDDRKVVSCVCVEELEKYIDYLEDKLNNVIISNSWCDILGHNADIMMSGECRACGSDMPIYRNIKHKNQEL